MRYYHDNVTCFITATNFLRQKLVANGFPADRIFIVRNAMEDVANGEDNNALGDYVAYCGRVSKEKGIHTFLKAASLCPEIPFQVAGRLREGIGLAGAPGNVQFRGFLQGSELKEFLASSRIVVVPSECYETFGMTGAEAMLLQRPLVLSRIGVFPEMATEGENALFFKPGDEKDLERKIRELWGDPGRCAQFGQRGRAYALQHCGQATFCSQILKVFEHAEKLRGE